MRKSPKGSAILPKQLIFQPGGNGLAISNMPLQCGGVPVQDVRPGRPQEDRARGNGEAVSSLELRRSKLGRFGTSNQESSESRATTGTHLIIEKSCHPISLAPLNQFSRLSSINDIVKQDSVPFRSKHAYSSSSDAALGGSKVTYQMKVTPSRAASCRSILR